MWTCDFMGKKEMKRIKLHLLMISLARGGSKSHIYIKNDSKFLETFIAWGYNQYEGTDRRDNVGEQ